MIRSTLSLAAAALAFLGAGLEDGKAAQTGTWIHLYNGTNLDGWVQHGGKARYRAEGPDIVGTTVPETPNSFLCTTRVFTNFILELEFKVQPGLNSGVQVRSEVFPEKKTVQIGGKSYSFPADRVHGYQVEIDPGKRAWSGGIYDEGRRGWLNNLATNEAARLAFKPEEWNRFRVECRDDSIRTWINGVPAADLRDAQTPAGLIALQVHGVGRKQDPMEVRWRNLRLQELP